MAFTDLAAKIVGGFAGAAGNTDAQNTVSAWQKQRKDQKDMPAQMSLQARSLAVKGLQQKLSAIDPQKDPTAYNALVDQIQEQVHGMREMVAPDQKLGPVDWLKAHTTDRMHITNQDAASRLAAKQAPGTNQDQQTAQALALSTPQAVNTYTQQIKQRVDAGEDPDEAKNTVFGNKPKPSPETSDTRRRADFAQYQKDHPEYKGTIEQWGTEQAAAGRAAGTPPKSPTGLPAQVVELQTKKALADSGQGPALTPQEEAKLKVATGYQEAQQRFQLKMMQIRGESYGLARQMAPLTVFDTSNGNAPTYTTYLDIKKQPGRFMPTGPASKAMAQENLMEDLQGVSANVRKSIGALKEDFPASMKIKIATAMRMDDPGILGSLISSGALGALTDDQQDFLVGVQQLKENALAMRSVLGAGQGSDDVRNAIQATLPTLLSPDRKYALKQLDAYDATVARLHRGVPNVPLNNMGSPNSGAPPAGSKVIKWEDVK